MRRVVCLTASRRGELGDVEAGEGVQWAALGLGGGERGAPYWQLTKGAPKLPFDITRHVVYDWGDRVGQSDPRKGKQP